MQFSFFNGQMDRLRRVYSEASLNEERVKVLWERFKTVDGYKFAAAVNHLIGEFTTQALPSLSRFAEAVAGVRGLSMANAQTQEMLPAHFCEPCRDFGFQFDGDLVVRCEKCVNGARISPEKLVHHQTCYDRGRKFFVRGKTPPPASLLPDLPYDKNERVEWR